MNKYAAHLDFGYPTMATWVLLEAPNLPTAQNLAHEKTIEWAESYGYYQDPDYFGDYIQVGGDWDEEEEEYNESGELDPHVELYDPEKHDQYL